MNTDVYWSKSQNSKRIPAKRLRRVVVLRNDREVWSGSNSLQSTQAGDHCGCGCRYCLRSITKRTEVEANAPHGVSAINKPRTRVAGEHRFYSGEPWQLGR